MGTLSIWHWLIVLVVVLVLFGGRGKISQIMGDFGKGLKSFKKSIRDDDESFDDRPLVDPDPKAIRGEVRHDEETVKDKDRASRS